MPLAPDLPGDDATREADYHCDVLVVGGGINGAGIARDLAGRGWRVLLCEQDDLASHTSSASTKLIHGGLRYLEYREFGLVRKALRERERLLRQAPHIMWPMRFVLPHDPATRPAWLIRLGLWLYDHLAWRAFLPGSHGVQLAGHVLGQPLQPQWARGFVYSDGWVDDARLVLACAQDAQENGARIWTRTRCDRVESHQGQWCATLSERAPMSGHVERTLRVRARAMVNAAGPWAEQVLRQTMGVAPSPADASLRLVKGSHIVVPRLFQHDHAYIFQGTDGRIIFAIPYEDHFTLIGTTDVEFKDDPASVSADAHEVAYLCRQLSRYLREPLLPEQVVWTYSGVRPLLDDAHGAASAVTRDYRLEPRQDPAPWLTVWGGKITTFRVLAEQAGNQLGELLGEVRAPWTSDAPLQGGDLPGLDDEDSNPQEALMLFRADMRHRFPWVPQHLMLRWVRAYGTNLLDWLGVINGMGDLGREVAPDLFEAELRYMIKSEWVLTSEDVLWRRSKLGLHYNAEQRQAVADWMALLHP